MSRHCETRRRQSTNTALTEAERSADSREVVPRQGFRFGYSPQNIPVSESAQACSGGTRLRHVALSPQARFVARCAPESVLVAKWPVSQWGLSSRARKECVAESRGMCPFHPAGLHPTEVQSGTEDPVRPAPDVPGGRGGGQVHSRVPGTCRFLTFTSPLRMHILARVRL